MKILLLNSEFPPIGGGAGNASANLARQLVAQGYEVLVITARHGKLPKQETWQGVQVLRLPACRRQVDRSGMLEQAAYILSACWGAVRALKTFQADVTLAFFGIPAGAVAWFLKKTHHLPYLVSLRGGDVPGFRPYDFGLYHKLAAPFLRRIWQQAGGLVANSAGLRQLALDFQPSAKIEIIPNGVDLAAYHVPSRDWQPARLLSVGRLVYQKGFDLAARALADLPDLPWEWVIVGDGKYRAEMQALVNQLGIAGRVKFAGWLERPALRAAYAQANLFLFPSRHEGMPNAVLEAMAGGLPVIASHIAGNEELVAPGVNGLLFPSEDVPALTDALRALIPEAGRRQHMGAAGLARLQSHYSWESAAQAYARLLEKLQESA